MVVPFPDLGISLPQLLLVLAVAAGVTIHLAKRRRSTEPTRLEDDHPDVADVAYNNGWRIDTDGWWWRPLLTKDREFKSRGGFTVDGEVYVKSAIDAVNYDDGYLPGEQGGSDT